VIIKINNGRKRTSASCFFPLGRNVLFDTRTTISRCPYFTRNARDKPIMIYLTCPCSPITSVCACVWLKLLFPSSKRTVHILKLIFIIECTFLPTKANRVIHSDFQSEWSNRRTARRSAKHN